MRKRGTHFTGRYIAAVTILAFALTACGGAPATYDDGTTYEVEDCDAEDLAEGDEDCYGIPLDGNKTKQPKTGTKGKVTQPKTTKPKTSQPKTSTPKTSTKSGR